MLKFAFIGLLTLNVVLSAIINNQWRVEEDQSDTGNETESLFKGTPTDKFANYIDLVPGIYRFYWNLTKSEDGNSTELIGEIQCRTLGWMGFGLSPNGKMRGSDVIVGWIDDGAVNFTVNNQLILYCK